MRSTLLLFYSLLFCAITLAQSKIEVEKRIDRSQFPKAALDWLSSHPEVPKEVRYYLEQDGEITSYEVKFKVANENYSIEFDEQGQLLDIEVLTRFKKLDKERMTQVKDHLDSQYKKWRLERVQRQYTLAENGDSVLARVFEKHPELTENLELEVSVKENGKTAHYELTFDPRAKLIRKRPIQGLTYDYKKF